MCNPVQKSVALVRVDIIRNHDKPSFDQQQYTINITELVPVGDVIYTVTASDKDSVSNNHLTTLKLMISC